MIDFKYKWQLGQQGIEKTMTAGELIKLLKKHPRNTPVLSTWEGIHTSVREDTPIAVVMMDGKEVDAVVLYVDQY